MGASIYLDDFGAGYSSLNLVRQLPIPGLKIDKTYMDDVETDMSSMKVVEALMFLCESLDLTVVAEGIEKESQLEFVLDYPKQKVQGCLLGRPMQPDALIKNI